MTFKRDHHQIRPVRAASRAAILRDRCRAEDGQSLVITVIVMAALLLMAALAIDASTWYQNHHQAQVAADAAALAGANCMADNGSPSTCAQTAANIASANGLPVPASSINVNTTAGTVSVGETFSAPSFFAKAAGIGSATIRADAVASYTTGSTQCTGADASTGECYAIFSMSDSCSTSTPSGTSGEPVYLNGGGYDMIGGIWSNGAMYLGGGGSTFHGVIDYGSTCSPPNPGAGTFDNGSPQPVTATTTWPINYATDFPACSGSTCNASGTPDWCSKSSPNFTFTYSSQPVTGNIYCAYGTGNKANPATWTGTIDFTGGGYSSSYLADTYVAGSITTDAGGMSFEPCGWSASGYSASGCARGIPAPATTNYPLFYAVGGGTPIAEVGGSFNYNGDIFAPNGEAKITGGSDTFTFIEAQTVELVSGGIKGDGPIDGGGGSSTGTDQLTQ
jgi:Flp pilus assembly protein TadG